MSFNEGAQLDTSQVTGAGGGGGGSRGGVVIGGGVGGIILTIIIVLLGGDPGTISSMDPGQVTTGGSEASTADFSQCKTGADANKDDTCRIIGTVNSVQSFWSDALPKQSNVQYQDVKTVIFSGVTQSACGQASNNTGPFYCPSDQRVYIDPTFMDLLSSQFGGSSGALAQEYVLAHEYGHHVQDLLGILAKAQDGQTGATSNSVRTELQADCFAGVWANHAATTKDDNGTTLLQPLTDTDIKDALSAAAAVGDDHIQSTMGGGVDQDSWTHGSSEERERWFTNGYRAGDIQACDTFNTNDL